jgi:hypothetical protein
MFRWRGQFSETGRFRAEGVFGAEQNDAPIADAAHDGQCGAIIQMNE